MYRRALLAGPQVESCVVLNGCRRILGQGRKAAGTLVLRDRRTKVEKIDISFFVARLCCCCNLHR